MNFKNIVWFIKVISYFVPLQSLIIIKDSAIDDIEAGFVIGSGQQQVA